MGFGQVVDNLTFKCMNALRKEIKSVTAYFLKLLLFGYMQSSENFHNDCKN